MVIPPLKQRFFMKQRFQIFALFLLILFPYLNGYANDQTAVVPKITLSAQGLIFKPADELQITISVVELGENAEAVLASNSTKMQAVIANLEGIGLTKEDYRTGRFNIHPTYTPYPKDPPSNWKPSINGYEVTNSITIKTNKITLAGKMIDAANKAGANSIENIHFALHDARSHWHEAISIATTNAINDANVIAQAASVKLGRLLSISLDSTNCINPRANNIYFAKSMGADAVPPIEGGDVTVTANVSIVYEINDLQ